MISFNGILKVQGHGSYNTQNISNWYNRNYFNDNKTLAFYLNNGNFVD